MKNMAHEKFINLLENANTKLVELAELLCEINCAATLLYGPLPGNKNNSFDGISVNQELKNMVIGEIKNNEA